MRWFVALIALAGCKYPDPGFGSPSDDQPPEDADTDGDGTPDDEMVLPACPEFMTIDNMTVLPGKMVGGFSPTEDESFAISWLPGQTLGYTEPPLGATYSPTDVPQTIADANLSPDGSVVYFFDANGITGQRMRRATNAGSPGAWNASIWSGLEDGYPGRPTTDDQHIVNNDDLVIHEWERMAGTWTIVQTYTPADFGNDSQSTIGSANLSPDGAFLVYTLEGPVEDGIHMRVRVGGTFKSIDGAYGRGLAAGTYRQPILTSRCSHLYVFNTTTRQVERFDVHP